MQRFFDFQRPALLIATLLLLLWTEGAVLELRKRFYPSKLSITEIKAPSKHAIPNTSISRKNLLAAKTDSLLPLESFYKALVRLECDKKGLIRIGYWGDSMIEGDIITGELRSLLQNRFGGFGVGFIPITAVSAQFRPTISHSFSNNWMVFNCNSSNCKEHPPGIGGFSFSPQSDSWVTLASKTILPKDSSLRVKLLYQTLNPKSRFWKDNMEIKLPFNSFLSEYEFNNITPPTSTQLPIKLKFESDSLLTVYGLSLESKKGVLVDNYSYRGSTGLQLANFSNSQIKAFQKQLNYQLIIIHFGVNIAQAGSTNYDWYENAMVLTINRLKNQMPNTSFLIVGIGDKGYKKQGQYFSDSSVVSIEAAQKRIAQRTNSAFWSQLKAMGGSLSIKSWADDSIPKLAAIDYIHLSYSGGKKIAHSLYDYLLDGLHHYINPLKP